ncbi:MAG: secretin N-terminal domain-containing protein [Gammaproteobacteria bacterium]|nr:secretin N-terminal domain-containing protein [Gammaproteobacteria bacterium]MBU1601143.1 secretin N-terminal domain-containing protein [Gammaproteobacteria bacterium]MBU2434502.1 secretin N-terminal domain-containing protein [Gammaproteobacteria bacterium]MBU2450906.1 secretin N-terminal domain-containing protein [Gammaproteobacteria bacterium]
MKIGFISATFISLLLAACAAPTPREPLKGHLNTASMPPTVSAANIPAPVQQTLALPKPSASRKAETYSVVVNNVPVRDLLFALARDAKVNVDIHPGITGTVTLNAIDQTLPQLLTRISKQVDMRFELDGPNLAVMPDSPFLKHYKVDYVNMARNVTGTVSTNTQIATGTSGGTGNSSAPSSGGGNISNTRIENTSRNQFWDSLEKNIKDILRETDKVFPEGSSETVIEKSTAQTSTGAAALPQSAGQRAAQAIANALQSNPNPNSASQATGTSIERRSTFREAASVIMNAESGVITVRATQRQHERIQEFVDRVTNSAQRQVLIEATIVEVTLKDGYQQGINWTQLAGGGSLNFIGDVLTKNAYNLSYDRGGNPDALITMLNTFGTTKVLSSPRVSVMNNQTALLKVVENYVYFSVKADTTTTANVGTTTVYTTTPQSVSVGLVVSVTPQISDGNAVTLNVRPTITTVAREVPDPNPDLKKNNINNLVPVIRTREIESVMRVASGNIAILGGLMEDKIDYQNQRVPLLGQIPLAGELVNNRNNVAQKTELVIFLRPVVIKDASLDGDFAALRDHLPGQNFFAQPNEAQPFNVTPSR